MTEFPEPSELPSPPPLSDGLPGHPDFVPPLEAEALGGHPLDPFRRWLAEAEEASGMRYPNALTLATVDAEGRPDARVVLLKEVNAQGFVFFTNHRSAKGLQLEAHADAALVFYWDAMGRQIRVRGPVSLLPGADSDAYFRSRPRGSRVGAWASEQSRPVTTRQALVARVEALEARYEGQEVPRPPHWGGYLLRPREVEFWQEGAFRLHDRFRFTRKGSLEQTMTQAAWTVERLQP